MQRSLDERPLYKIMQKWTKRWEESGVFEADADSGKPKFYLTAAFPYPNSPPHIGHARTYTITDVYARYLRMKGYNVLLPMGFHYTGTPIVTMAEFVEKDDKELIDIFINVYGVPEKDIDKLKTPLGMAEYFSKLFIDNLKKLGLSIDWRRKFRSIDPEFQTFVTWQYLRLREKGFITQGTHPVGWCPVHNIPVGMHDTKGDVEPEIGEFTVILFKIKDEDVYLAAATLRPETILGAVNIWIKPEATYVIVKLNGINKKILVSEKAAFKLKFQRKDVRVIAKVLGQDLLGKRVVNPVTERLIPILPADFVEPDFATGVVMSVPAHAPYDYVALQELLSKKEIDAYRITKEELEPVLLIDVKGYKEIPAAEEVEKLKVRSQREKSKLDKATQNVYSAEYKYGKMREGLSALSGTKYFSIVKSIEGSKVPDAREIIKKAMIELNDAFTMYEILNRPVYCRCGTEIVVKLLEDQWFLDYSNEKWKSLAKRALSRMKIVPEEIRGAFERTIDWLKLRAMARTRGLGTPLPWDKSWVIESLSDSTIYMAYYTVSHLIRKYKIKAEQLTPEVWDYILLGKGDPTLLSKIYSISEEFLKKARLEFTYWYPLDSRHSGKDLIENHLTFMIFHHAALFPEDLWPRQIVVNGFVLYEGKKMSKSLRNIVPLSKAIEMFGPDGVRTALIYGAELGQDLDFYPSLAQRLSKELENFISLAKKVSNVKGSFQLPSDKFNKWLVSRIGEAINKITKDMDSLKFRAALHRLLFELKDDLEWWLERKGYKSLDEVVNSFNEEDIKVLRKYVEVVVKMLQPFAPFTAEEVWEILGNKGFVSLASWPSSTDFPRDYRVELEEYYVKSLINDINEIIKLIPGRANVIKIVVSLPEHYSLLKTAIDALERKDTSELFKEAIKVFGEREGARKAKQLFKMVTAIPPEIRNLIVRVDIVNEYEIIRNNLEFITGKVGINNIVLLREDETEVKEKTPLPFKPAIIIQ